MYGKTNAAWADVLKAYPDIERVTEAGNLYRIAARDIKRFREPRLMAKHDYRKQVPDPLSSRGLNMLAVSRSEYVIGKYDVFHSFDDAITAAKAKPVGKASLPCFDTLDIDGITTESNAINALQLTGALGDFLGERGLQETFNGRLGTGSFDFSIDMTGGHPTQKIHVDNAQLEIDGGFENATSVVIMEAKNVIHDDFNIRQLYYPFRCYREKTKKPIRLVFSQYDVSAKTYLLIEYAFSDAEAFSSIVLKQAKRYKLCQK